MTKTVGVTGVATGIGAEITRLLKQQGHRVVGFDIAEDADHVDRLIHLDLADPTSIIQAIEQLGEPLHGLCNNAGIPPKEDIDAAKILQVNFFGQRQFTRGLIRKIEPGGSIVNMASRAGHGWKDALQQNLMLSALESTHDLKNFVNQRGINAIRAYNLSKEAMILWTLAETENLIRRQLRMNSVSPGAVATGILDDFAKAFGEKMATNVARAGRPAEAQDVAEVAVFLLSDRSSWLKGIDIPVDGGMGAFSQCDKLGLSTLSILN